MSDPLRIAATVEGPTDAIVMEAILNALLPNLEYVFQTLQPEGSVAFGSVSFGRTGGGWAGVYRWCRQAAQEGQGAVSRSAVLSYHDLLIVHVDADVAGKSYAEGNIRDAPGEDLPCEEPCPPPERTTNALRAVIVNWLGEQECPLRIVLCTPSKSTEAWVVAAVWPDNNLVLRNDWECRRNPEVQLRALPRERRFEKRASDYRRRQTEFETAWPSVAERLSEAARFERELLAAIPAEFRNGG